MGVFQSVGGAATSGQGFRGDQITSAIIAALLHSKYSKSERSAPRPVSPSSEGSRPASETLPDFEFKREELSTCPYVNKERNIASTIEVTEYAPVVFHALRSLGGTSDDEFLAEWDLFPEATNTVKRAVRGALGPEGNVTFPVSPNTGQPPTDEGNLELGEGRSMALFLKSKSMAFMCKTISETEVQVLVSILRNYLQHIERNVDSMLMRFVMMLKVSVKTSTYATASQKFNGFSPLTEADFDGQKPIETNTEVGYVLCFNDCFSNCDVLHERWDLKGRHPKPGKFRHFPDHQLYRNRVVQPKVKQNAMEQHSVFGDGGGGNRNRDHNRFTNLDADGEDERRQQADLSSEDEEGGQANLRADKTLDKMRLNTRKDKDLARLFWLEPADREYLIQQITADFEFLLECGLMDYSILIGVRYNTSEEQYEKEHTRRDERKMNSNTGYTPRESNIGRNSKSTLSAMKMPFVMGEENNAGIIEVRPSSPIASGMKRGKASQPRMESDRYDGASPSTMTPQNRGVNPSIASVYSDPPQIDDELDEFHSQFHLGVDSIECVETYYIGIIDMLTVYNGKKKTANFCKKCLWQENTLSTIPPKKYAERIEKYAHRIFPKVAIEEHQRPTGPEMQHLAIGRGKVSTHAAGFKVAKDLQKTKKNKDILVAPSR